MQEYGNPTNWPSWLRITLIVLSGFLLITIPFMFWKRMRFSILPYAGMLVPVLMVLSLIGGQSDNEQPQTAGSSPTTMVTASATPEATSTATPVVTATASPTAPPTLEPTVATLSLWQRRIGHRSGS